MDQPGSNHVLLRVSQPDHAGHPAVADRMRDLLARTAADHFGEDRVTAVLLEETRQRLESLEHEIGQLRDLTRADQVKVAPGGPAEPAPEPAQSLAGVAATLDGLAASLGAMESRLAGTDARVGALDNRLQRLDERLDDQYDRATSIDGKLGAADARMSRLADQFSGALASLGQELRHRPDRAAIEESLSKITGQANDVIITRIGALEDVVLTLAEILLRPAAGASNGKT